MARVPALAPSSAADPRLGGGPVAALPTAAGGDVVPGCQFASDNTAGICPEALAALERANAGSVPSYGDDPWTTRACDAIRELFEHDADVFFVFNGTAANALALAAACRSHHAILCHEIAHVEADECGAPAFFAPGTKLLLLPGEGAKLRPDSIRAAAERRRDIHYSKPRAVSVTQATELSTIYSPDEIAAIGATCRELGLALHMDGARFANAVAALGVAPKAITWQAGVDVLCLGGTKNGIAVGEAVVFFDKQLAADFAWRCKQAGQLASKMRYVSAPWVGLVEQGVWLANARRANAAAARLEAGFRTVAGIDVLGARAANALFVRLSPAIAAHLRGRGWRFYEFPGSGGQRFMCSWATTDAEVDALVADARAAS